MIGLIVKILFDCLYACWNFDFIFCRDRYNKNIVEFQVV